MRRYRASQKDCGVCELKPQCCPKNLVRKVPRHVDEDARDVARALAATPEFKVASRRRKKVEMLFAHLKRILGLGRLRLRGPSGARDEFLLAATAQDLRRLARLRPDVLIMHPGPINRGVEVDSDVADGKHSVILEQVTNGLAIRMAVLYLINGTQAPSDGQN